MGVAKKVSYERNVEFSMILGSKFRRENPFQENVGKTP